MAAVVAAVVLVGRSTAAPGGSGERLVTVGRGVVQATVSGSGSLEAAKQVDLNFETSGTLTKVYVEPGEHVHEGQLLAQLDPTDAQEALDDAEEALADAQPGAVSNTNASYDGAATDATIDGGTAFAGTAAANENPGGATVPQTTTTPAPTTTTPDATTTPEQTTVPPETTTSPGSPDQDTTDARPDAAATGAGQEARDGVGEAGGGAGGGPTGADGGGGNAATDEAAIEELEDAVEQAEEALAATKLRAPMAGTVASVEGEVGEEVGSGSSGTGDGASGAAGGGTGDDEAGSGGGDDTGATGAFVTLVDLDAMNLVVGFSEADIGRIRRGQPATVAVNALPDERLAAHVVSVSTLPSGSDGVVTYDVTFRLDQLADGLKAGMTASADVVVEQVDDALNVASAAVTGRGGHGVVTLADGDDRVQRAVTTGIVGDSTTQILSGLRAGDQVVVAAPPTTTGGDGGGMPGGAPAGRFGGGGGGGAVMAVPGSGPAMQMRGPGGGGPP